MLTFNTRRRHQDCDGQTRRDFLKVGALGMGALGLPSLMAARAHAAQTGQAVKDTSVVWLWLSGGPTHVETFDPKMTAPVEYRSTTGEVKTTVPGMTLGGTFPKMAQLARPTGGRPLLRPHQQRARRRHALPDDRLRQPQHRQRRLAHPAVPRLDRGQGSRLQSPRHRHADLCPAGRDRCRRPGLFGHGLCPVRLQPRSQGQHDPANQRSTGSTIAGNC